MPLRLILANLCIPDVIQDPNNNKKLSEISTSQSVIASLNGTEDDFYQAMGRIFTNYQKPLVRVAQAMKSCSQEEAEEFIQRVFEELMKNRSLKNYTVQKGKFRSYLWSILKLRNIDDIRRKSKSSEVLVDSSTLAELHRADNAEAAATLDYHMYLALFNNAIASLESSGTNCDIFKIPLEKGLSLKEYSVQLEQPYEAIKKASQRLKVRIQESIITTMIKEFPGISNREDALQELHGMKLSIEQVKSAPPTFYQ